MRNWDFKRKIVFFIIIEAIFIYFGLALITAATMNQIGKIELYLTHPYLFQFKTEYLLILLIINLVLVLLVLAYIASFGKRRPGVEYGSAKVEQPNYLFNMRDKKDSYNLLLTQNVKVSLDSYKTKQNNNILVIGGSGSGKNKGFIEPNVLEANQNYLIIDPKGSTYELTKVYLKKEGYEIRCLNFVNPELSDGYNPLDYIQKETDIAFISKILAEVSEDKKNAQNPFWDNTARLLIETITTYVYYFEKKRKNINRVFELFNDYKVNIKNSELYQIMSELANSEEKRSKQLSNDFFGINNLVEETLMTSLGDTSGRLQNFRYEEVQNILEKDDLNFIDLGIKEKQAIFVIISDAGDTTYNFLISILYQQFFITMYKEADKYPGKRMPFSCTVIMDEFKNIRLPENFNPILSTVRSRGLSIWIIIQGLSQLKELFKDSWEQVLANCSYMLYLGTGEQFTHEYISKAIGSETITKRSYSGIDFLTRGKASVDVIGREIYKPNEIRELPYEKCFLFVAGKKPVLDQKITIFNQGKIVYEKFDIAQKLSNCDIKEEMNKLILKIQIDSKNRKKYLQEYSFLFTKKELLKLKKQKALEVIQYLENK